MTMAILPKLRSKGVNLTAGADNVVYTCPANHTAKMTLLFVANATSGNKTVTIKWYDITSGQNYYIVGGYVLSAYNFLKLSEGYLVMNSGDYMTITPEAGSIMDCTVTVEEYYDPSNKE